MEYYVPYVHLYKKLCDDKYENKSIIYPLMLCYIQYRYCHIFIVKLSKGNALTLGIEETQFKLNTYI